MYICTYIYKIHIKPKSFNYKKENPDPLNWQPQQQHQQIPSHPK